ncbi:MAG: M48 family metallopeptidase [Bernardetiaceae bacterium]|jgi:predicted Zn-dependent protease|nr:M48 family metallopeptidase [Bernardetiaceae bacterium]
MKLKALAISLLLYMVAACQTVPITGRKQLSLIPANELLNMSATEYRTFLGQNALSKDAAATAMVRRVGERIQAAVQEYMRQNGAEDRIKNFQWEFNLVEDKTVNAWCMPGGKVVIYTGILPVCRDETGLAVVMGHEIAHAVAGHGDERLSQNLAATFGQVALQVAMANKRAETRALWGAAFGVGTQLGVLLPFSRTHESEADRIGLVFSAMAGYDPREAPKFWGRMAELGGGQPPEFLSTHPSHETRIKNLEGWIQESMPFYEKSPFRTVSR